MVGARDEDVVDLDVLCLLLHFLIVIVAILYLILLLLQGIPKGQILAFGSLKKRLHTHTFQCFLTINYFNT